MSEMLTPSEAAANIGVPAETLGYWERAGLLEPVARDVGRRRRYSVANLEFVDVIRCLRVTGVPVRLVRRFTDLVRQGPASAPDRLELLREHRNTVIKGVRAQQDALVVIKGKIARYEEMG